jgi:hypothetical protein
MPYKRSVHRDAFDERLAHLLKKCRRASRLRSTDQGIRDLVFQCAILQTSAAMETYLKLLIEGWAQKIRIYSRADKVPVATRAFLTSRKLDSHFSSFRASGHEAKLLENLSKESTLWQLMLGHTAASFLFDGKQIYDATAYPSYKNLNRLF